MHCPVLRPFFLTAADEARIRTASETIADIGERVVAAAMDDARLLAALGVTEAEERLIRIDPGYARASTASRLDAFLLPDSLHFAEYNAESPAGPAYTQRLCELFDALEPMAALRRDVGVTYHRTIPPLLAALLDSYRDWGGTASPPTIAIVDFRGVPTWTEFELLRDAFVEAGVPTVVCDPARADVRGWRAARRRAERSISSTAACCSTTSSRARTTAPAWSTPTSSAPSAWRTPSAASCRTRRRSSRC